MAVHKLEKVETDQDGFTQAAWDKDAPRWLYASCMWYKRIKMAVSKLHGVKTNQL